MTNNPPETPAHGNGQPPEGGDPNSQPTQQMQGGINPQLLAQLVARGVLPYPSGTMMPPIALQQTQFWQGPYPPPDVIERYEKILPGVFGEMVSMAKQLQTAQIEGNQRVQIFMQADTKRGHYLGFIVSIAALIGAGVLTLLGHPTVGVVCLSVPVMAVATAFINSTKKNALSGLEQSIASKEVQRPERD